MFLASSFLRCRRVPFKTQATSGFAAPRLFSTSINRSIQQKNTHYIAPSSPPKLRIRFAAKRIPFHIVITILKISAFVRKRFATRLFIYGFSCYFIYKGIFELSELIKSPSLWMRLTGHALVFGPIFIPLCIGPLRILKLGVTRWPLINFATRVFIYGPLCIPISVAFLIGGELICSHPMYPPHIKKDLKKNTLLGSVNSPNFKDSLTPFQYEVLPEGYIRLVHIKPGNPEDPIELELNSIRFRPFEWIGWRPAKYVPLYEALSYTWDDDGNNDKLPVMVNGKPLYVTSNLHSALLAIRRKAISVPLWTDAICIDQNDITEKEQQLRIMHQIYKNAINVRIWLGQDDQSVDIHAALKLISHCMKNFEQVRGRKNSRFGYDMNITYSASRDTILWRVIFAEFPKLFSRDATTEFFDYDKWDEKYLKEDEREPIIHKFDWHTGPEYSSSWKAIKNILTRSYFNRSWIIQEISLSSNRSMFVGDYDVTDILRFVTLLHDNPEIERQLPSECRIQPEIISRIYNLITVILLYELSGVMNLGHLLSTFRGKGSTQPHDQVYSLLGLTVEKNHGYNDESIWTPHTKRFSPNRHVRFPDINYKQSIQKLCTDTTEYMLKRDTHLDALRLLATHARPTNEKDWPSWVPDFTSPLPGVGEPRASTWALPPKQLLRTKFPKEMWDFHIEDDKLLLYGHVISIIKEPIGVMENIGQCDKELNPEKQKLSRRFLDLFLDFLPMSVWIDSGGREVRGVKGIEKGDLVVVVPRGMNPLILRRLKDGKGDKKRKETDWPEYTIIGTAHIPKIGRLEFNELAKDIVWDFQKMAIV